MEMKDDQYRQDPNSGTGYPYPSAMNPAPGYSAQGMNHPAPGYPPQTMQGPYGYGQPQPGAYQDGKYSQDQNSGIGYPPEVSTGPSYSAQGYPPMNYPAPGYPSQTMQGPYGYGQPQPGAYQGPQSHPNYGPYAGGPPIQNQPMGPSDPTSGWMPAPSPNPSCPPGLEYLYQIDQLLVHQQVELLEAFTDFESNNKFEIKNSMGQRVYFAAEENDCCTRNCCGSDRPFTITIIDNCGREVMRITRPLRCSSCCFPCCLQKLEVQAPPGNTVGYVKQNWHPFLPKFTIQNEREEDVLKVEGPCLVLSCGSDVNFELKSLDGDSEIGRISKQWTGLLKESFTDADNFGVQFPMDLDVKMKAVVLGACFLIDFMFFEKSDN